MGTRVRTDEFLVGTVVYRTATNRGANYDFNRLSFLSSSGTFAYAYYTAIMMGFCDSSIVQTRFVVIALPRLRNIADDAAFGERTRHTGPGPRRIPRERGRTRVTKVARIPRGTKTKPSGSRWQVHGLDRPHGLRRVVESLENHTWLRNAIDLNDDDGGGN